MISRLETMDGLPIPQDPFALRIVSAGQSYGLNTPFLDIWQGNGLLLSRMDGAVTLAGIPKRRAWRKPGCFWRPVGEKLCSVPGKPLAVFRNSPSRQEGRCWFGSSRGKRHLCPVNFPLPGCCIRCFPPVKVRLSRFRNLSPSIWTPLTGCVMGTAAAVVLEEAGEPAACALALAVTDSAALLTAVAVVPAFRRKGLGRQAVETLCCQLSGRKVFLFRAEQENQAFYEALSFLPEGNWVQGRL